DRAVFLEDWPAPLAALARRRPDDPRTALRFEAYVGGLELANAFGELTDPVEQRARVEYDQATRRARNRPVYPIDDKVIGAAADGRAARRLAATGGIGLAALIAGGAPIAASGSSPYTIWPGVPLVVGGTGLVLSSWFADIWVAAGGRRVEPRPLAMPPWSI